MPVRTSRQLFSEKWVSLQYHFHYFLSLHSLFGRPFLLHVGAVDVDLEDVVALLAVVLLLVQHLLLALLFEYSHDSLYYHDPSRVRILPKSDP